MITSRRGFIRAFASLLAAPAIVQLDNIMPVKALPLTPWWAASATSGYYKTQFDDVIYWSGYETIPIDRIEAGEAVRIIGHLPDDYIQRVATPLTNEYYAKRMQAAAGALDRALEEAVKGNRVSITDHIEPRRPVYTKRFRNEPGRWDERNRHTSFKRLS